MFVNCFITSNLLNHNGSLIFQVTGSESGHYCSQRSPAHIINVFNHRRDLVNPFACRLIVSDYEGLWLDVLRLGNGLCLEPWRSTGTSWRSTGTAFLGNGLRLGPWRSTGKSWPSDREAFA